MAMLMTVAIIVVIIGMAAFMFAAVTRHGAQTSTHYYRLAQEAA